MNRAACNALKSSKHLVSDRFPWIYMMSKRLESLMQSSQPQKPLPPTVQMFCLQVAANQKKGEISSLSG